MSATLLGIIIPSILTLVVTIINFRKEILIKKMDIKLKEQGKVLEKTTKELKDNKLKLSLIDRALDLTAFNQITGSVDRMFSETRADRFLILMAVNGKEDFNVVTVIFEQHKVENTKVNAVARYRNVEIDPLYRNMLKLAEVSGVVHLETSKMEDCLLKDFYRIEGVTFSDIRFLLREHVDHENDILVFSSVATHGEDGFTKLGRVRMKTEFEAVIRPELKKVLTTDI